MGWAEGSGRANQHVGFVGYGIRRSLGVRLDTGSVGSERVRYGCGGGWLTPTDDGSRNGAVFPHRLPFIPAVVRSGLYVLGVAGRLATVFAADIVSSGMRAFGGVNNYRGMTWLCQL
ncbi:uncharacterized protein [Physcomitrium patens]|uniref:uncharacterized protein n=1 Tax=Physcomitrium patens TaxID=3218 RepID=UPI003CCD78DD